MTSARHTPNIDRYIRTWVHRKRNCKLVGEFKYLWGYVICYLMCICVIISTANYSKEVVGLRTQFWTLLEVWGGWELKRWRLTQKRLFTPRIGDSMYRWPWNMTKLWGLNFVTHCPTPLKTWPERSSRQVIYQLDRHVSTYQSGPHWIFQVVIKTLQSVRWLRPSSLRHDLDWAPWLWVWHWVVRPRNRWGGWGPRWLSCHVSRRENTLQHFRVVVVGQV